MSKYIFLSNYSKNNPLTFSLPIEDKLIVNSSFGDSGYLSNYRAMPSSFSNFGSSYSVPNSNLPSNSKGISSLSTAYRFQQYAPYNIMSAGGPYKARADCIKDKLYQ